MSGIGWLHEGVVAAIGGGLGAALSALGGFVLFGVLGVLGVLWLLFAHSDPAVGPTLIPPSVCFLGGVVATAYARKRGLIVCGKDIGRSFLPHRRADIFAVGAVAGVVGHGVHRGLDALCAGRVDTVALTVVLIPLFLKFAWRLTRTNDCDGISHAVPSPYRFFERLGQPVGKTLTALGVGAVAALATGALWSIPEMRPTAGLFVFFVSATLLFPVFLKVPMPATHHYSGPAGAVAVLWLSASVDRGGGMWLLALWGAAAAQIALLAGNLLETLLFTEGDIHVDPPSMGILVASVLLLGGIPGTGLFHAEAAVQVAVASATILVAAAVNARYRPSVRSMRSSSP